MRRTVPNKAPRAAYPAEQPGAAWVRWCSPPSSEAAQHRTRRTTTTACWPPSKTFSRCHASDLPGRPEWTGLDPTSSTCGDQPSQLGVVVVGFLDAHSGSTAAGKTRHKQALKYWVIAFEQSELNPRSTAMNQI